MARRPLYSRPAAPSASRAQGQGAAQPSGAPRSAHDGTAASPASDAPQAPSRDAAPPTPDTMSSAERDPAHRTARATLLARTHRLTRSRRVRGLALALAAMALGALLHRGLQPLPVALTQRDIDAAVLRTLETETLPSPAARAWEVIRPSLVRVRRLGPGSEGETGDDIGVGTGVVIVDSGLILTNLHVVVGADALRVVFADGLESPAKIVKVQPDNDLAVLQATTLPDDLVAATLKSTADLRPGDAVVAHGFPFGVGPSVTAGVVSGLNREFRSPEGKQILTRLIQFDAPVNPGSSGGPLTTPAGEVVGIVTAVLNPTEQRVFVGIGFAVPIESAASGAGIPPF